MLTASYVRFIDGPLVGSKPVLVPRYVDRVYCDDELNIFTMTTAPPPMPVTRYRRLDGDTFGLAHPIAKREAAVA